MKLFHYLKKLKSVKEVEKEGIELKQLNFHLYQIQHFKIQFPFKMSLLKMKQINHLEEYNFLMFHYYLKGSNESY